MKAIYINDERTLQIIKGALGKLGMRAVLVGDVEIDGKPVSAEDLRNVVLAVSGAEEVEDDGVDPDFLTDAERFVVASGIGALVAAGAGAPDSVVLSITEKLGLVLNTEQKIGAVAELAAKLVAERK